MFIPSARSSSITRLCGSIRTFVAAADSGFASTSVFVGSVAAIEISTCLSTCCMTFKTSNWSFFMSNPLVNLAFVVGASVAKRVAHQFVVFRGAALQNSVVLGPPRARASGGLFLVEA